MRSLVIFATFTLVLGLLAACTTTTDSGEDDPGDEAIAGESSPTPESEPTEPPDPDPTETPESDDAVDDATEDTDTDDSTDDAATDDDDAEATEHVIEIQDPHNFVPDQMEIAVGDTITFINNGNIVHTSTLDPEIARDPDNAVLPDGADTWDSGDLEPGDEFSITLEVPGEYVYFCRPHEALGQIGSITVNGDGMDVETEDVDDEAVRDDDHDHNGDDDEDDDDGIDDYL